MPLLHIWNQWRYFYFESETSDRRRIEILNRTAPSFFRHLEPVLADHIMLGLARLNDNPTTRCKGGEKCNFVLRAVIDGLSLPPGSETGRRLQSLLEQFRASCDKLKQHRDKRIAHNDFAVAMQGSWVGLLTPTYSDIDSAMRALQEIVILVVEQIQGPTLIEHQFEDRAGAGQLVAALENASIWRELRTRAREMSDAEIASIVRRGMF